MEFSSSRMGKTVRILRRSVYTFLQRYDYFTTIALLALPFSVATFLSQAILPMLPLLQSIHHRLQSVFQAAGFPRSSESRFFSLLNLKLSQTITSYIIVLPFTLSFLLISKAFIIRKLQRLSNPSSPQSTSIFSFIPVFNNLLLTQVCNSFVILSANAATFCLLFIAINCLESLNFSASTASTLIFTSVGAAVYSIILANAFIICNLALVISGMEGNNGGFIAILKACFLIRGRTSTALSLAIPFNLTLAAVEALFHYRVITAFSNPAANPCYYSMALEGLLIAYLYSIIIVLDTIACFLFYKSCKDDHDLEKRYCVYRVEVDEEDGMGFANVKRLEVIP